jgi:sugar/nucleoside kinase (ribokinase family)
LSILVVGSVGLDNVQTPFGTRIRTLGGACSYFAAAASLYDCVRMVAVVGRDFPQEHLAFFESRGIDLRGLQIIEGQTFFWAGRYSANLDDAETLDTQLNVFADFHPIIPPDLCSAEYVFLANIDPDLQIEVLDQITAPRVVALDSMNFWVNTKRDALTRALSRVDIVLLNETEVRLYTIERNLFAGARHILALGPKALIIKRGEHGALLITRGDGLRENLFVVPAYPVDSVVDPTGAGDTFAAGFMGYLAKTRDVSLGALRRAMVHGAVVASFTVQDFSIDRLRNLTLDEITCRYDDVRCIAHFEPPASCDAEALKRPLFD